MKDKCYASEGVHIPGCWGCAIYDHDRCTCAPSGGPNHAKGTGARLLEAQYQERYGPRNGVPAPTLTGWQD